MFKKIVAFILKVAVKILLWRKKPEIIAITGSAGKTTTKELTQALLSTEFEVLASAEGYNTELGAPLMLFGEKSPVKITSIKSWLGIIFRCYKKAFFVKKYPEKVIVEMGADAPGDIEYLARLFRPNKGVILTILPVHMACFKNIEAVAKEKGLLAQSIRRDGKVFLNIDDERVAEIPVPKGIRRATLGTKEGADFRAKNIKSDLAGLSFDLYEGAQKQSIRVRLYGEQMIYPLLSAIAIARCDHISYKRIQTALQEVKPFKGRMNVIEGKADSIIIDDSYNAGPESVLMALDFLGKQTGRRIALLGSMNELGQYEREAHEQVGESAAKNADMLVTVGETASKYIVPAAKAAGMTEVSIHPFTNAVDAGKFLVQTVQKGDVVLAKGSQNKVRLERAIEHFMAHPEDKEKVLVRQSRFWQNQR